MDAAMTTKKEPTITLTVDDARRLAALAERGIAAIVSGLAQQPGSTQQIAEHSTAAAEVLRKIAEQLEE